MARLWTENSMETASMTIASVNPATGEVIRSFDALSDAEIEAKIAAATRAFSVNRERSFADRATRMLRAAMLLESRQEPLGRLRSTEMGTPVGAPIPGARMCALVCRSYAENGAGSFADEPVKPDALESFIRYEPIGPVLAVMPWNFPLWQVFRFAASTGPIGS